MGVGPEHGHEIQQRLASDPDELLRQSNIVRDLIDGPGWALIEELADAKIASAQRAMEASGRILEQAQYAQMTGRIAGIRDVLAAAKALAQAGKLAEDKLRQIAADEQREMTHAGR